MIRSGHVDTFARDNLPPQSQWPEFRFTLPELQYPERLNCVDRIRRQMGRGRRGRSRSRSSSPTETLTYAQLAERINRIANVLTRDLGMVPGNRVLMRSPNSPMGIAVYLAVIKAGGVMVATMPLLRAKELSYVVTKAKIKLALCDARLADEMEKTRPLARELERIVYWGNGELEALMAKPGYESFTACDTASDDVCLIAFTSGTTGEPKGTMHFQRDMLASCDSYSKYVLRAAPRRPLHRLGAARLHVRARRARAVPVPHRRGHDPARDGAARRAAAGDREIPARRSASRRRPPIARCWRKLAEHDISSLRKCVSAGETLPKATFDAWQKATGMTILDGIGATEMMHIFIGSPEREVRAGATGKAVPGYEARVIDDGRPRTVRPARSAVSRCAGRPAAAISRTRGRRSTCRTAGTSPATPI